MRDLSCSQAELASFNSLLIPLIGENPNSNSLPGSSGPVSAQPSILISHHSSLHTWHSRHTQALFPETSILSATSKQVFFSPQLLPLQSKCSSRCPSYALREFVAFLAKPEGRCNINFLHSPLFLAQRLHRIGK